MSKEIFISSTPHETRLAIVEDDALTEVYYERENEYTLAGSIYNGKVTRVLPGMQSAFVDIGLERDAFLYITDFMEEAGGDADFEGGGEGRGRREGGRRGRSEEEGGGGESRSAEGRSAEGRSAEGRSAEGRSGEGRSAEGGGDRERRGDRGRRGERGRGDRDRGDRGGDRERREDAPRVEAGTEGAPRDAAPRDGAPRDADAGEDADGSRRWRGRRGRRRGRGGREDEPRSEERQSDSATGDRDSRHETVRSSFAPKFRPAYGEESYGHEAGGGEDVELNASAQPEAFVLPGESLSKYRGEPEKKAEEPKQSAGGGSVWSSGIVAKPSTLVDPAGAWDGGLVLPGETLSRRGGASEDGGADRGGEERSSERSARSSDDRGRRDDRGGRGRDRDRGRGGRGGDRGRGRGDRDRGPRDDSRRRDGVAAAAPVSEKRDEDLRERVELQEVHKFETEAMPQVAAVREPVFEEVESEFEPDEASASHRVDVAPPSEFRLPPEAEEQVEEEIVEEEAGPQHEVTTIGQTGEMVSHAAPVVPQAEEETEAEPIAHEQAVRELDAADAKSFAPGQGELEEELLEDEESEGFALQAHADDEDGDLEEETLEGAADLGTMLREMSIDEITRPEEGEEEDEADSDDDLEEEEAEFEGFDSDEEGSDEDEADASEEELVEGETAEGDATADGAAPQQERRGRRDGRRGMRRGGRDREGRDGRRGGGRERGRRSMQTTNLPAISELLKPGQEILVQIAKEPIAKKGARITSHIALPGRFLVFMPTVNHTGVSRKIASDSERHRLKQILLSEKGDASGGFIVRTAAEGASEEELRSDLRFLLNLWAEIKSRSDSSKSPALLYHDLNLVERILRDQVSDNFSAIWVDTEADYKRILRFLQRFHPSLIRRVKLYSKETPLFEQFGVAEEINKALRSKVWLKSGGSIVINQTEALVAIDINTGKYVGKTARLEDTIVKTNLDAIPEIVRQIRLRDLGGIIIIDFIDMDERKNRHKVMQALEDELKKDRAPSKVLQFNDFGLVAITRKRVKQSLERTLSTTCGVCQGTGMVKNPVTVCNDIYVEMRKMHRHLERGDIMLRVHPDVVKQLKSNGAKWLQEMEEMAGKTILVKSDPSLHPEQFDIH